MDTTIFKKMQDTTRQKTKIFIYLFLYVLYIYIIIKGN